MDKSGLKLTCVLCLALTACSVQKTGQYPGERSEAVPNIQEPVVYTESEEDPVAAHLAARQQVDPRDTSPSHKYTTKPTAAEINRETARVAKVEKKSMPWDFKQLVTTKPDPVLEELQAKGRADSLTTRMGTASSSVMGIRSGEHPDKVRVVLDVSAPAKFNAAIDNVINRLVISLPDSDWQGIAEGAFRANPLAGSYSAQQSESGTIVTITLKKPAKLVLSSPFPPNETYGHRIVFDVAPL